MGRIIKFVFIVGLIVAAFGAGTFFAHHRANSAHPVGKGASRLKDLLSSTESRVGESVTEVQVKWRRKSALDQIEKSLSEYEAHNYGTAEAAAREAREQMEKWLQLEPARADRIRPIIKSLEETERLIRKESPKTREKLNAAKQSVEKL